MRRKTFVLAVGLTLLLGLIIAGVAYAQQPQPTPSDDQVNAIARQLYCPVCENTPLDVCPTTVCAQWRELIRQKIAAGWTEQEIKDYFVQQYGARVLGTPPAEGLNWLVYIIPPLAILAGLYVLFHAYRTWKRQTTQAESVPADTSISGGANLQQDEYIQRLEDQVRKR